MNTNIVQCWGLLNQFWIPIVHVTPLETPFGLVISLFTIPITRHYNRSQLSTTRLRVYTIITLARSELQSLIPLLHVYTVYVHYTLIFTALLHIKSPNWPTTSSLLGFSPNSHYHWLSHTVAHAKSSLHLRNSRRHLTPRIHCFLNTDFYTVTPGTELNCLLPRTHS
jgi:hypothetical protein